MGGVTGEKRRCGETGQGTAVDRTVVGFRPAEGDACRMRALRWALLVCAAVLIGIGICNGGARDVLVKAVAICTECIGLG